MMDAAQHIWACALAVEKQHGADAARFVAERIAMWKAISARLEAMRGGERLLS